MSAYVLDGIIQVHYVATIADPSAPTVAEVGAGVDLSGFLRPGGDWDPIEGSTADAATGDSAFNKTAAGTFGGQPLSLMFAMEDDNADDTAWTTLPRGTQGFMLIARRTPAAGAQGALAAADLIDLYAIDVYTRKRSPYTRNEIAQFQMDAAVTADPNIDVAIAA